MILLKPVFVNHDGSPIFCVDLHPQGMKFVTGGLSRDGGRVILWNLFPVVEKMAEEKDNIPRKLWEMTVSDCVYCLRWNHAGNLLASAGGGQTVVIWKKDKNQDGPALFETETWSKFSNLNGHTEGVLDLAWATQNNWLAAAGADRTVIIWNVTTSEIVTRLAGHEGKVKGVSWDPVGMYLATQSDDKTCRIWRTADWHQQIEISEPFRESPNKAHFLRLSWSPDGQYLVTANATNSGEPTARIVEINGRPIKDDADSWSCEMDFVGHHKEVTCVRFNSALFKKPGVKTKHCVLATGSRDNTVAVWSTVQRGPIVVVRNLFSKCVEDLAWGPNGLLLVACSADGTVGVMVFKELGQVVSREDQVTTLESMYGKSYAAQVPIESRVISFACETPASNSDVTPGKNVTSSGGPVPVSISVQPKKTAPEKNSVQGNITSSEKNKLESQNAEMLHAKQIETRLPDGKRRITPITLSRSGLGAGTFSSSSDLKTKIIVERGEIIDTARSNNAETERSPSKKLEPNPTLSKVVKRDLIPIELPRTKTAIPQQCGPRILHPSAPILCPLQLPDAALERIVPLADSFVETFNNNSAKRFVAYRTQRSNSSVETVWQISLKSRIIAIRATEQWSVVIESDRVLHIFDTNSGRNVHSPICLPQLPAHLILTPSQHVCIINLLGHITVWDLRMNQVVVQDKELRSHLISNNGDIVNVLSCEISCTGTPVLGLSSGATIHFSRDSGWVLLCDVSSSIWRTAVTQGSLEKTAIELERSISLGLAVNESKWSTKYSLARINAADNSSVKLCAAGVMINLLLSAEKMHSPLEYKSLMVDLARFFAENVNLVELEILLKSLTSPVKSEFIGLKKIDLLNEILEILKSYPHCEELRKSLLPAEDAQLAE